MQDPGHPEVDRKENSSRARRMDCSSASMHHICRGSQSLSTIATEYKSQLGTMVQRLVSRSKYKKTKSNSQVTLEALKKKKKKCDVAHDPTHTFGTARLLPPPCCNNTLHGSFRKFRRWPIAAQHGTATRAQSCPALPACASSPSHWFKGGSVVYSWDDHEMLGRVDGYMHHAAGGTLRCSYMFVFTKVPCLLSKVPSRQVFSILRCNQQRDIRKSLVVGGRTSLLLLPQKAYLCCEYFMAENTCRERDQSSRDRNRV